MSTMTRSALGGLLFAMVTTLVARAQESNLDKMVEAALHGPEIKKAKYLNHEFHVKKAKITDRVTGITRIEGQISHYVLFRPDEQFYYTIEKQNGMITKFEFKIEREKREIHVGKLTKHLPVVGVAQQEISTALRKLSQKLDGTWEAEAELITLAIALRVDPMSHGDLVSMLKEGKQVELVGATRPLVAKGAIGGARDRRKD